MTSSCRLLPLVLLLAGCATVSAKDREQAASHFQISQTALAGGDPRTALGEIEQAARLDPREPEIHHLHGLLLHVYFGELGPAEAAYLRAIALRPGYSEAKVNLSAVYLATGRCELAVPMLEEARRDLLYREPYLAENNLGWCKYQLGDSEGALRHLRSSIALNPGFCLGYRNLGEIMENQGRMDEALRFVEKYAKSCPDVADAELRRGLLLLERGRTAEARTAFLACSEKAKDEDLAGECVRHAELIPGS
ncbi:MAG TPA: tetratricopeptide repeat protein [Vulgatibacter sp.]